ncbi:MAG: chlorophyll a/b-binding protein [cyanobacterium endosymbiont of Rhopalodia sterrenbergii]
MQYERRFSFTAYAETLNGRLAMICFVVALITELVRGRGIFHFRSLPSTLSFFTMITIVNLAL